MNTHPLKKLGRARRHGLSSISFILLGTVTFGMLALCVDYGLKVVVDAELQSAADSSARAGCQQLLAYGPVPGAEGGIAATARQAAAESGTSAGKIEPSGVRVELGNWDTDARHFTPSTIDDANAVRTTVTRSAAHGNAVPNPMGSVIGLSPLVSSRQAIGLIEPHPDYALIGIDRFVARGLLTVNGPAGSGQGSIASNGNVELNVLGLIGITFMDGHVATRGVVKLPLISALTHIRDGIRRPDKPFVLPPVSLTRAREHNNNDQLGSVLNGSGDLNAIINTTLPSGTYVVRNLNLAVGVTLRTSGPVLIFVEGDVNLLGAVNLSGNDPANFKVRVAGDGHVLIGANVVLPADIYAPESDVLVAAGVFYNGRLIGRTINILGTSLFSLRPELPAPEIGRSRTVLVK